MLTRRSLSIGAVGSAIALSLIPAGLLSPGALFNWGGLPQFWAFWLASLTPDLSSEFIGVIGRAMGVTFAYAVCGTALSVGLGFLGGVVASETWWRTVLPPARQSGGRLMWVGIRGLLAFPRAIHELIWGLFFLTILGLDPLVAVVAIAIPFSAIVAKVFSEILDETPQEPLHALINSGVAPATAWLYGLLPQAFPNLLSYASYRFECSLRSAAVLGVIGAGGLGYEILLSLQSLRYHQLWTGFYALIVLNGTVDLWSAWMRWRMGFTNRLDLNAVPSIQATTLQPSPDWTVRLSWVGILLAIPLSFVMLDIDWGRLWSPRTYRLLAEVLAAAAPQLSHWQMLPDLLRLSGLTLAMSILAIAIAAIGGILFSFPAARTPFSPATVRRDRQASQRTFRSAPPPWQADLRFGVSRLMLLVSRAIPAPIWALVFLFILFPGILPGALALGIHNFGILGRLMAEVNENLDDRPSQSLWALGASPSQVILYSTLPQNLGRFWAYICYRWEVCLRETVIVGLVGADGLGRLLSEQLSSFDYGGLTLTLGCFVLLTFVVDLASHQLRSAGR
jgi:phosphonate transport system permease protein